MNTAYLAHFKQLSKEHDECVLNVPEVTGSGSDKGNVMKINVKIVSYANDRRVKAMSDVFCHCFKCVNKELLYLFLILQFYKFTI